MTPQERKAQIYKIAAEEIATFPEKLTIIYNWWRYELALIGRDKAISRAEKYSKRLFKDIETLNFRYEMQDL